LAGCSFVFDDSPPDIPLVGLAPRLEDAPTLRQLSAQSRRVMLGADGAPWAVLSSTGGLRGDAAAHVQAVRLHNPREVESYDGVVLAVGSNAFYGTVFTNDPGGPTVLFVRKPGGE